MTAFVSSSLLYSGTLTINKFTEMEMTSVRTDIIVKCLAVKNVHLKISLHLEQK